MLHWKNLQTHTILKPFAQCGNRFAHCNHGFVQSFEQLLMAENQRTADFTPMTVHWQCPGNPGSADSHPSHVHHESYCQLACLEGLGCWRCWPVETVQKCFIRLDRNVYLCAEQICVILRSELWQEEEFSRSKNQQLLRNKPAPFVLLPWCWYLQSQVHGLALA